VLADLVSDESYLALHNGYMCSGSQLLSLARRCLHEPAVCCNVHPKNMMLLKSNSSNGSSTTADCCSSGYHEGQLLLLDIGCDWVPASPCKLAR
jgi:hypothetical protein